jgi:hypothetical protein
VVFFLTEAFPLVLTNHRIYQITHNRLNKLIKLVLCVTDLIHILVVCGLLHTWHVYINTRVQSSASECLRSYLLKLLCIYQSAISVGQFTGTHF